MKKNIIIFAFVAIAALVSAFTFVRTTNTDELLKLNVEAIAENEVQHTGNCYEQSGECSDRCPVCGELVYAKGHLGPAYNIKEKPVIADPNL